MDIVVRNPIDSQDVLEKMYGVISQREVGLKYASITLHHELDMAHDECQSYTDVAYVVEINFLTKYVG